MSAQSNRYKEKFLKDKIELDFKIHLFYSQIIKLAIKEKSNLNYLEIMNNLDADLKYNNLY